MAVGVLGAFALLRSLGPQIVVGLRDFMRDSYVQLSAQDLTVEQLSQMGFTAALTLGKSFLPLAMGMMVFGVAASLGQTGLMFAPRNLKPDFKRLNPLQGARRMFSGRALFDLAKTLVKVVLCGVVLYQVVLDRQDELLSLGRVGHVAAAGLLADVILDMGLRVAGLLVVAALLDFGYQRYQFERGLRMTKEEVKEEMRSMEGDPHVKGRIRGQQRALARRRMMQAVPTADVLVTNPTHLAIALKYNPQSMGAPRVVAKGERLMAERIINLAKEHKVPIVRNIPLAHALYRSVEVGAEVPASLYKAVAEVLAFVYRLKEQQRLRALGAGG